MDAPAQIVKLIAEMHALEKTMTIMVKVPAVMEALSNEYELLDSKLKALVEGGASMDPVAQQQVQCNPMSSAPPPPLEPPPDVLLERARSRAAAATKAATAPPPRRYCHPAGRSRS